MSLGVFSFFEITFFQGGHLAILKYEIPCPELGSFSWECFISREQAGMCSFSYFSRAGGPYMKYKRGQARHVEILIAVAFRL